MVFILNVLFAVLAFFLVRYVAAQLVDGGKDKAKVVTVIALIGAVVVYLVNFAQYLA